jgi:hypothetical protein
MKIKLEKLAELIPTKYYKDYLSDVYLTLATNKGLYSNIRYIDVLANLLGGIGVASIECNYLFKTINYENTTETFVELQTSPNYALSDLSFRLYVDLTVEIHGYDYTIENVLLAHKLLKQFDLYE